MIQREFIITLSRAQKIAENIFGILSVKCIVFLKPINLHPKKAELILNTNFPPGTVEDPLLWETRFLILLNNSAITQFTSDIYTLGVFFCEFEYYGAYCNVRIYTKSKNKTLLAITIDCIPIRTRRIALATLFGKRIDGATSLKMKFYYRKLRKDYVFFPLHMLLLLRFYFILNSTNKNKNVFLRI